MQFWGTYQGYNQSKSVTNQLRQTFYYPRRLSSETDLSLSHRDKLRIDYSQTQEKTTSKTIN